jgi:LDH2 family malate/lactate/ureidoglycolate dehydrogenase
VLNRLHKPVPEGWVINEKGEPLTDPALILDHLIEGTASLLPLGGSGEAFSGYKGYGYATLVEILSSALQDGVFLHQLSGFDDQGNRVPYRVGHFFVAINIEHFISLDKFKLIAGSILRTLRASKKIPGETRIYTAGEKEYYIEQERRKTGIPLPPIIQQELKIIQDELKLDQYSFPF